MKISIDTSDLAFGKPALTTEDSIKIYAAIRKWQESLGDKSDVVEVVTVRTEGLNCYKQVVLGIVIVEPEMTLVGRYIHNKDFRSSSSITINCDKDNNIPQEELGTELKKRLDDLFQCVINRHVDQMKEKVRVFREGYLKRS